jgi:hypothetical protein
MALYAVAAAEDALAATKEFLLPVDFRQWAKLALVVLFVGGGGGFNIPGGGGGSPGGDGGFTGSPGAPSLDGIAPGTLELAVIAAAVLIGVILLVVLALLVVGPIMEYVLFECLRTQDVALRSFWSAHWRAGLGLLGFRLGLLLALVAVFLPLVVLAGLSNPLVIVLAIPVAILVVPLFVLVNGFTTLFVVPITIVEECGLIAGWRQLWPTLRDQPQESAAFAVGFALVSIALRIAVGIVTVLAVLALLVPFAILALLAFVLGGSTLSVPVIVAIGVIGLLFLLLAIATTAVIQVPAVTYKRYYALLVLGDLSARFDLIPGLRGTIRADAAEE